MSDSLLPLYRCHKQVRAAKISSITEHNGDGEDHDATLAFTDSALTVNVGRGFLKKHSPEAGGYYVRYADGYESYSPAEAFEAGYTLLENHRCAQCQEMIGEGVAHFHFQSTHDKDANHYHFKCWEEYCHGVRGTPPK